MRKFLLKTPRQYRGGGIASALGFVVCLAGEALRLPDSRMAFALAAFTALSVWTLISALAAPHGGDSAGVTPSFLIGQTAVTLLLAGCLVLTLRAVFQAG